VDQKYLDSLIFHSRLHLVFYTQRCIKTHGYTVLCVCLFLIYVALAFSVPYLQIFVSAVIANNHI